MRTPKRRLYTLIFVGAVGVLLLYRFSNHRRPRDLGTPYLDDALSGDKNGADDVETGDQNSPRVNDEGEKEAEKREEIAENADDSYEYNYAVAKLGFKRFKNQLQKEAKKKEGIENIDLDEDEELDDYYQGFGNFMDAIKVGDDVDDAKLAKMRFVDRIRDKLRPLSYDPKQANKISEKHKGKLENVVKQGASNDPETNNKKQQPKNIESNDHQPKKYETHSSKGLFSGDGLVRNCITNGIIGRVPGVIRTSTFTDKSVFDFSEVGRDRRDSFGKIFKNKVWGHSWDGATSGLDVSGRGATLSWTQEITAGLHGIINQLKTDLGTSTIRLLDIPCGDMKWMSRFLSTRDDIEYTGVDIVHSIIEQHRITYRNRNWKFLELDIVEDDIPDGYDLIVCRTLLQHLFTADVGKVLEKISSSGIRYFFATTFPKERYNSNLEISVNNPGRFRELNLEIPPFSLEPPLCLQRDGPSTDIEGWKHFMGLWRLPFRQVVGCDREKEFDLTGTDQKIYSCMQWSPYIDWDS